VADILIVEDDELIASSLARALGVIGHRGIVEGTVAGGRSRLDDAALVLCDLGLPDGDGLDLVTEIAQRRPTLPVIVLTARAEEADVVDGLWCGAVDYIVKPFVLAELLARVSAQLRFASALEQDRDRPGLIRLQDVEIDTEAHRVRQRGIELDLRPKELALLVRLAMAQGTAVPRDTLMHDVWGAGWWGSTKTLDVHVSALRRRLGPSPSAPHYITTVRNVGYRAETG
jgi:DNA-binding response OmpR family regulator